MAIQIGIYNLTRGEPTGVRLQADLPDWPRADLHGTEVEKNLRLAFIPIEPTVFPLPKRSTPPVPLSVLLEASSHDGVLTGLGQLTLSGAEYRAYCVYTTVCDSLPFFATFLATSPASFPTSYSP